MLHAYVERFDVMGGIGNILGWHGKRKRPRSYGAGIPTIRKDGAPFIHKFHTYII
jgi:hypothetical protein